MVSDYPIFMNSLEDPLISPPPPEVPLRNAPLVRVIAQVRFPEILSIEQRDFVAPFQEALRATYPVLRPEQSMGVLMAPSGISPAKAQTAWRFSDIDANWRVSLTTQFVALETKRYTSRADFFDRLRVVLTALEEHIDPKLVDRLGVRYIDRITGSVVDEIATLVRPEVRGISGTAAATHAVHALSETMFELSSSRILARWGQLPAGATVDPAAVEPIDQKSWILDLDMFSTEPVPFSSERVVDEARTYAERIYTIFRWAVSNEFLRRYGGAL